MKKCVHCKEMIDEKATKCKFCQADLRNWFMKHKIMTFFLLIFGLIVIFISSVTEDKKIAMPESTSPYEIVTDVANNGMKTIDIYTTEKRPEELIKINDKLVLNNNDYSVLDIRYFDDKSIIDSYFDKQMNESVTEKEKDELFKHYIADFKSTTNEFNINKIEKWELIKQY